MSFTKKPQTLVLASLGSDVTFRWDFTYGNVGVLNNSTTVIWGKESYGYIVNKYITVTSPGNWKKNKDQVSSSITSRLHWNGNFNQNESVQMFTLRNVIKSDQMKYACKVQVDRTEKQSASVELLVRGKSIDLIWN